MRKIDTEEKIIIFLFDIQVIINSKVIIIKLIVIITQCDNNLVAWIK